MFDAAHRFTFQHLDDEAVSTCQGFLTGAAGVALALADHAAIPMSEVAHECD